ncbi:hypothetical protein MGLY_22530 [Neomoorella glycerini]|uniref:Uncharacterized protein n=1 Tax=Neomoorella glycerini TaxID=55779 RepID=A0A6I5ZU06_9FIRM|nr:hypothetical protein [Moorella glycerini]QGP92861.1 hypothetical protein MGLY_22530 [Moorella glycerini]
MAYLFLVTGAILIGITCLPAFKILLAGEGNRGAPAALGFDSQDGRGQTGGDGDQEQLAERLATLQEEVTALTARLEELAAASEAVPGTFRSYLATALAGGTTGAAATDLQGTPAGPAGEKAVPEKTTAAGPAGGTTPGPETLSIQEQIRLAHAAGESIDSLARRFSRGKGEIALILNLKR